MKNKGRQLKITGVGWGGDYSQAVEIFATRYGKVKSHVELKWAQLSFEIAKYKLTTFVLVSPWHGQLEDTADSGRACFKTLPVFLLRHLLIYKHRHKKVG